jgi:hypothetical protein
MEFGYENTTDVLEQSRGSILAETSGYRAVQPFREMKGYDSQPTPRGQALGTSRGHT